ncbi:hypothetical protein CEP54_007065 [Fusarium duplospermum]|uniref:Uncharacterized protein n=1 Tax=Fusarium duplospermum TaxID=1325734 RepID=A0A428Q3X0_9HYPO|nr:hypothetical protein CEP54_007065 [Fusarium duplospermum]
MSAPTEQHSDDGITMPPNKATAPSQQSDPDSGTDGDPDNDSDGDYPSYDPEEHHPRDVTQMRAWLQSKRKPIEEADLDAILGPAQPTFTATWKKQDEDLMILEWDSSPEKKAYACIDVENASLITLWKVCMRILRCSPLDLISPLLNLKYHSSSVVFSEEFCDALAPLIVHPILANDRRPWRPEFLSPALEILVSSMRKHSSMPQPIHRMHCEARQRADQRRQDPGYMSDIMYEVGKIVNEMPQHTTSTANCTLYKEHEVYCVISQDVKTVTMAIRRALWSMKTVKDAYEVFQQALDDDNDPPNAQQIREFYERAGRHQLRLLAMAEKRRAKSES